jgi:hypothetical protein
MTHLADAVLPKEEIMHTTPSSVRQMVVNPAAITGLFLGVISGVLLGHPHFWMGALFGWFILPDETVSLLIRGRWLASVELLQVIASLYYPLALLCYGACAFRSAQQTHTLLDGRVSALLAASMTSLVAIIPTALTLMVNHGNVTLSNLIPSVLFAFLLCAFLLLPSLALALLAGYVGARLGHLSALHFI